jgi:hypothetical protein
MGASGGSTSNGDDADASGGLVGAGLDDAGSGRGFIDEEEIACQNSTACPRNGFCSDGICHCTVLQPLACAATDTQREACTALQNDPDRCGSCANECAPGAGCQGDQCGEPPLELAKTSDCGAVRIAVDDDYVYWTEALSGFVRAVPIAGGDVIEIAQHPGEPFQIAVGSTGAYWLAAGEAPGDDSQLMMMALPLAPSTPRELVTVSIFGSDVGLAAHEDKVYYGDYEGVHEVALNDPQPPTDIVVADTALNVPQALFIEGDRVIWYQHRGLGGDDLAPEMPGETSSVMIAEVLIGSPKDIVHDANWAYWIEGAEINRVGLGSVPAPVQPVLSDPIFGLLSGLALDATGLYVASKAGQIVKHPLEPAAMGVQERAVDFPVIARDQPSAQSLTVHEGRLYWATEDCAIRSVSIQ